MITIPEIVEKIVKNSTFLEEGLNKKIINLSALSRIIKPEIEKELYKKVKNGAITMALKRLSNKLDHKKNTKKIFSNTPNIIVRSNLIEITFANSQSLTTNHQKLFEIISKQKEFFGTITEGVFETTLIASEELESVIKKIYQDEKVIIKIMNLSSITIKLPKENIDISGVYYFILKPLAWEGINITEVVSTTHEITLIFREKDIDRAFIVLKSLFN